MMTDLIAKLRLQDFSDNANQTIASLLASRIEDIDSLGLTTEAPVPEELTALFPPTTAEFSKQHIKRLESELLKEWGEHPVPVLLCFGATPHLSHPEEFDIIVTRSIQLAVGLAAAGDDYDDQILDVCRRAWRLKSDDFEGVIPQLPPFQHPFATIAEEISSLASAPGSKEFALRFTKWARSIQTFVDKRQRHKTTAPGTRMKVAGQSREVVLDDDDDLRLTIADAPFDSALPNAPEEIRHDRPIECSAARIQAESDSKDRHDGIVHVRGEHILNRQHMQYVSPRSHPSRLTTNEALQAFHACYERAETSSGYLFTALSMLTGRRVDRLISLKLVEGALDKRRNEYWLYRNRTLALYYESELPRFEQLMQLDIVESSGDGGFALPIPPKLAKPLLAFLRRPRKPSVKSDVTSVISQLVQQIDARITSVRLSKVMKHELTLLGIDEVDVALLSGIAAEHCAGLYYSTVPRERLAKTYYRYVSLLLRGHPDKKALKWPPLPSGDVGSRIRIRPETVARYFELMATTLEEARARQAASDIHVFHNRFLLYVVQLLSLCSAVRSVTEPFGDAYDFNLDAGTLRLSDKSNRDSACDRLVPMARTAVEQAKAYFAHLKQLRLEFRDVRPSLADRIDHAISGDDAWLFWFDQKQRPRTVTPEWILRELRHVWPLPTNWPRHFLSSWVRDRAFGRGVIRAYFGHADHGPAPLSHFDGTSAYELRQLGEAIDNLLTSLDIGARKGWNTLS